MSVAGLDQPAGPIGAGALLGAAYEGGASLRGLQGEFRRHDYVALPGLLHPDALAALGAELRRIDGAATAHDFSVEGYATPRRLSTLGGERIRCLSPMLTALYTDAALRRLMDGVVGGRAHDCPNPSEFMVANIEAGAGATHGWHLDDLAYALVVSLEAPAAPAAGGLVEFIRDWRAVCERLGAPPEVDVGPTVDACRLLGLVRTAYHAAGDAYLLRADCCLHRVTELTTKGARRVVLVLAFDDRPGRALPTSRLYADR
jgi:hypothetical protein